MRKLFGTDGVRGIPGRPPLTPELVRRLGRAAGRELLRSSRGAGARVLLGRDTRGSGPALLRQLAAGLAAAGCRPTDLGIVPTPAVSYLCPRRSAAGGAVISASHNPAEFNGIKFFTGRGAKLSAAQEAVIERGAARGRSPGARAPRIERDPDAVRDYADFLRSTFPVDRDLDGLTIVFDGANGAAAGIGPELLRGLGAKVFEIGCSPNGRNINEACGATATERLCLEVVRRGADCGVAMDGDADRALFADEKGRLIDGDALIVLSALHLRGIGALRGDRVVLTVMSNLGAVRFLDSQGIGRVEVPVGDKNVSEALFAEDLVLGGENSGHLVFRNFAPTGDGLLTAIQTIAAWKDFSGPLSRVRSLYKPYPQVLKNVRAARRIELSDLPGFARVLKTARGRLGNSGRIFVRYSGTEPVLRILVEGRNPGLTQALAGRLAGVFASETASLT